MHRWRRSRAAWHERESDFRLEEGARAAIGRIIERVHSDRDRPPLTPAPDAAVVREPLSRTGTSRDH